MIIPYLSMAVLMVLCLMVECKYVFGHPKLLLVMDLLRYFLYLKMIMCALAKDSLLTLKTVDGFMHVVIIMVMVLSHTMS